MNQLPIARIDLYKLNIARKAPFRIALGTMTHVENILVRIVLEDGRYGLGEGSPVPTITGETQAGNWVMAPALARLLIGKDALAIAARVQDMDRALFGNPTLKSAFDMALYDLAAKVAGLPLYAFLGGEKRSLITDDTIGIDTPEVMAAKATAVIDQGFQAVKIKLGTSYEADLARVRAVRAAIGGGVPLRIAANHGWDVVTAVRLLTDLAAYNVQYCEEPIAAWNLEGQRTVRRSSPIPIMADESLFDHHDAQRLIAAGACDYFNIKLAKSGGIFRALQIDAVADAAGIPCQLGCMFETRLAGTAAAHLVSARTNIRFADLDSATGHAYDPVTGGIRYDAGQILLPDEPGIGADFEPAFLAQMEQLSLGAT